ncbi:LysM repeat protein [Paenibacillus endophyticus]|uniref:LysM repeat protein n=1 Tax=Paenibacillus endophyticus TaxID=1294268 RepID=A0A7W5C7P7_9BACL|nr:hypothetical protein [Paenibacillus endophyticus]MBB3152675.1 LysM repeat protein [Paenibacillus endophyticus]
MMKAKAKAITAGAITLTLALGGGSLWAKQYVNAASSAGEQLEQSTQAENSEAGADHARKRGGFGHGFVQIQSQLLEYLGLEEAALQTKLETATLSEVAVAQGKTRAELKTKLVEWLEAAVAAAPAKQEDAVAADTDKQPAKLDIAAAAERLLDSKGNAFGKHGRGGNGFVQSSAELAAALGVTEDVLKTELEAGKTLAALAAEKGVEIQTLIDLQVKDKKTKLAAELAAGTITQEQYNERFEKAVERSTQHVNGVLPQRGKGGGFERNLDELAAALGVTEDVLKTELESGKTLAAIAAENGVDVQVLIDLQVNGQKTKLAAELAAGTITQEQYDTKLAGAAERAAKQVNGELKALEGGRKGGAGGKGPRGERPEGAVQNDQAAATDAGSEV